MTISRTSSWRSGVELEVLAASLKPHSPEWPDARGDEESENWLGQVYGATLTYDPEKETP